MLNESYFQDVRYFALARQALLAAFKTLDLKAGDQVLLPGFICREVLAPLHMLGLEPVYYEVSKSLRPLELPRLPRVRAVLAVNYFGFAQDLEPFRKYCEESSSYLIEDNAHGYLSIDPSGQPLGSRGDIGIFSMRKTFSIPDGSMLKVNNQDLLKNLPAQLPLVKASPSFSSQAKTLLLKIERKIGFKLLWHARQIVRIFRQFLTGQAIVHTADDTEFMMSAEAAPLAASLDILKRQEPKLETARRRQLYREFDQRLKGLGVEPVFDQLPELTVPYGYVFYAEADIANKVRKITSSYHFDCFLWPELPSAIQDNAPPHYRSLWVVNFIC